MKETTRPFLPALSYCLLACLTTRAATLYVWTTSPGPVSPYRDWATAAHTIQDAVDAAAAGDEVVVTNGVYATGGKAVYGAMTNRVAIDKAILVRSVNGPAATVLQGAEAGAGGAGEGAVRCVYVGDHAVLSGFTVTNGHTLADGDWDSARSGGGVFCEASGAVSNCVLTGNVASAFGGGAYSGTLSDCTLTGNSANSGGGASDGTLHRCTLAGNSVTGDHGQGGGAWGCRLNNCTLTGNSATGGHAQGGGSHGGTLNNCTLTGNEATIGGGASGGTLHNCIVYFNTATEGPNCGSSTALNFSCTAPLPANGIGNITSPPLFVDPAGGNLRLASNAPCINAGNNRHVTTVATDLDGNPRIVSGTVDIGAYEYQGAGSVISYAWLQQYGLPIDGSEDFADPDGDGMSNWQEWVADTNPTSAASCLRSAKTSGAQPLAVSFPSSVARVYSLLCCSSLTPNPVWTPVIGQTGIPGSGGVLTLADTNPLPAAFGRVWVSFP